MPELKWPNDLLVGSRKLAGILAEADGSAVVVGMGMNVNWPDGVPDEIASIAVAVNEVAGQAVDVETLLQRWLAELGARYDHLDPSAIAVEHEQRCATLGKDVKVELANETFTGRAVRLTVEGHLVVDTDAGQREVSAGDVIHLR